MGNTCCTDYQLIDDTCGRCGRPGHHRNVCYASTYHDGSKIRVYCRNCQHYGHSENNCSQGQCILF